MSKSEEELDENLDLMQSVAKSPFQTPDREEVFDNFNDESKLVWKWWKSTHLPVFLKDPTEWAQKPVIRRATTPLKGVIRGHFKGL